MKNVIIITIPPPPPAGSGGHFISLLGLFRNCLAHRKIGSFWRRQKNKEKSKK